MLHFPNGIDDQGNTVDLAAAYDIEADDYPTQAEAVAELRRRMFRHLKAPYDQYKGQQAFNSVDTANDIIEVA